jgi:hypothetical protein
MVDIVYAVALSIMTSIMTVFGRAYPPEFKPQHCKKRKKLIVGNVIVFENSQYVLEIELRILNHLSHAPSCQ